MSLDFRKIFIGSAVSLAISVLFMCVLAVFVFFLNVSDRTTTMLIFVLSALAVFLGALLLAKNIPSRGLINGLILALIYFLVLSAVSFAVTGGISLNSTNLFRFLATLFAGMLGGILGINGKKDE